MAVVLNGIALSWGVPDFAVTASALGQVLVQDFDHSMEDSVETYKDRQGKRCTECFPDPIQKFTFNGLVRAASGTNTLANAKTQSLLPLIGTLVSLTFTSTEYAGVTTGLTWTVKDAKMNGTNTSAMKVSLGLEYASGITAVVA
jgi:hypothetical protein